MKLPVGFCAISPKATFYEHQYRRNICVAERTAKFAAIVAAGRAKSSEGRCAKFFFCKSIRPMGQVIVSRMSMTLLSELILF